MMETSEGATLKPSQDASRILSISIGLDFVAFLLAAGGGGDLMKILVKMLSPLELRQEWAS